MPKRRMNPAIGPRPLAIGSGATAVALALVFTLLSCGGPQERTAQYRMRAQEYLQAGNFSKARVALRNALKIDSKDAEAYFLMAQIEEKEKNWRNAVANYQRVVELVPDHRGALITLAKYYLEARLTDQVNQAAEKVLAKHVADPQASALKIAVLAQQDRIAQAVAQAEDLSRRYPSEPDVAILLATLYGHQQRLHDAKTVLRRAIKAHPHHIDLLQNLKTVLVTAHDAPAAEVVLHQLIEEEPTVLDHQLKLAWFYTQQEALDQAEAVLREASKLFAENEQTWLALTDFLAMWKGREAAETALRDALRQLPYSIKVHLALAALYERHKDYASARAIYDTLLKQYDKKATGLEVQVKIAQLDFTSGRMDEAERRLAEVLKVNPRLADGLILQGQMALTRRNGKEAVQAFRTVLRDQPELAHVQYLLGQAHVLAGEAPLARDSFERAATLYPGHVDAMLALAMLDSQQGQFQRSRARLEEVLKKQPAHFMALEMLFAVDLSTRDWIQAKATAARLRLAVGESPVAFMAEGRLHEAQGHMGKAIASFERATLINPEAPEPLLALIRLEVSQKQIDRARLRLGKLVTTRPDHPYVHGLLGELSALTGRQDEAGAHFREATRVNPTWITPWLNWATLALSQGTPEAAGRILEEGLAVNEMSEELHMFLASVLANQGRIDEAIAAYGMVLRTNPRNVFSANNLAALLADYKGDAASLERAFALSRDFEKDIPHPLFLDTLGWVRFKMGQQEDALRLFKQALAKAPSLPALNYHLGTALYQSGQKEEAKVYFSKALRSTESFQGRQEAEQLLAETSG